MTAPSPYALGMNPAESLRRDLAGGPNSPSRSGASSASLIGMVRLLGAEERVFLSCQNLRDKGARLVAEEIAMNCKVKELLLGGNDITDVGTIYLAEALETNTNLRFLGLSDNKITDAGAERIAKALKINRSLKELALSSNKITDKGVIFLAAHSVHLEVLYLQGNTGITVTGGLALLDAIASQATALRDVDLRNTNLPPDTLMQIAKSSVARRPLHLVNAASLSPSSSFYNPTPSAPAAASSTQPPTQLRTLSEPVTSFQLSSSASAQAYIESVRKEIASLLKLKADRKESFLKRAGEAETKALEEIAMLERANAAMQKELNDVNQKLDVLTGDLYAALRRCNSMMPTTPRPESPPLGASPPASPPTLSPRTAKSEIDTKHEKEKERENKDKDKEKDKDREKEKDRKRGNDKKPRQGGLLKWILSPTERDVVIASRYDELPRGLRSHLSKKYATSEQFNARWPLVCAIFAFTDNVLIVATPEEAAVRREKHVETMDKLWLESTGKGLITAGNPHDLLKKLQPLGEGGFGKVYSSTIEKRPVAVKQIPVKSAREKERALRELAILRQLHKFSPHPNIVQAMAAFEADSELWVCMELIDGATLETLSAGQPEELEALAYVFKEVLTGLKFIHSSGVVHGDIKASNIMISRDADVKLIDFGLSFQEHSKRGIAGTANYMAPEIILGQQYSSAIDIWALGMTLAEVAQGEVWMSSRPAVAMWKVATEEDFMPPLPKRAKSSLVQFVTRCVTRSAERRPHAQDLLNEAFIIEGCSKADIKSMLANMMVMMSLQKWQVM